MRPPLNLLDRAMGAWLKESLGLFILLLAALACAGWIWQGLIALDVLAGPGVSPGGVMMAAALQLPLLMAWLIPLAWTGAVIAAGARILNDGEWVAWRSLGGSGWRLSAVLILVSLLIGGAAGWSLPWARKTASRLAGESVRAVLLNRLAGAAATNGFSFDLPSMILHQRESGGERASQVFIADETGRVPRVILAEEAHWRLDAQSLGLRLNRGEIQVLRDGGLTHAAFDSLDTHMDLSALLTRLEGKISRLTARRDIPGPFWWGAAFAPMIWAGWGIFLLRWLHPRGLNWLGVLAPLGLWLGAERIAGSIGAAPAGDLAPALISLGWLGAAMLLQWLAAR